MSDTEIVNLGLARAQVSARLSDLASDTTAEAKAARDCYDRMRDNLLRDYLWSFSKKRQQLAELTEVPPFGFDRAFGLPGDFLRAISVHPGDSHYAQIVYKLETVEVSGTDTRVISTNATQLFLRYVKRQTLTGLWDPMFVEAFAWSLGEHFALVIKESTAQAEYCAKRFSAAITRAKAANAIEDWPEEFPEGSWVTERFVEGDSWAWGG